MKQEKIFKIFKLYFPQFSEHVTEWFPNGRNSIRVRNMDGEDFIFTYHTKKLWMFETVDAFLDRKEQLIE